MLSAKLWESDAPLHHIVKYGHILPMRAKMADHELKNLMAT